MLIHRCDRCRREVDVKFVGYDHSGPGLSLEYRCSMGHLFVVPHLDVQPRRTAPVPRVGRLAGS